MRGGHLGDLEGVGEPGALVVAPGTRTPGVLPARRRNAAGVQDAVTVALEAGAHRVGGLGRGAPPGALGPGG